jgi:nickel-dependent lactate racemase
VLQYLALAGIGPESVTIITAPGPQATDWIDDLPDEFADVHTEVHHPDDRNLLSYLSTTKRGRRVYLNRTLLDSDQIIILSGRGYDAQLGYAGCEGAIYPALADADTRQALADELSMEAPGEEPEVARSEALEIAWLLSSTFFVQVIETEGDAIAKVCAGLISSSDEGIRLQDERWRFTIERPVDVVIASIGGDPRRHDFLTLARAVTAASRAVEDGGCIVVLSESEAGVGEAMEVLRHADEPYTALKTLNQIKPVDPSAAFQWASVAERARIYLVSGMKPEIVEEMFATPICSVEEVQRLIDSADSCLILPEAHKTLVVVE